MDRETTYSGKIGKLERLSAALAANSGDLQHLEGSRTQFVTLLNQVHDAAKQQAALMASKQEASRQLKTLMVEGERLATVLQLAVKHHYGIRAEKLTEFGMQPFRGRKRNGQEVPETPPEQPAAAKP